MRRISLLRGLVFSTVMAESKVNLRANVELTKTTEMVTYIRIGHSKAVTEYGTSLEINRRSNVQAERPETEVSVNNLEYEKASSAKPPSNSLPESSLGLLWLLSKESYDDRPTSTHEIRVVSSPVALGAYRASRLSMKVEVVSWV